MNHPLCNDKRQESMTTYRGSSIPLDDDSQLLDEFSLKEEQL
jgi:hypothetical protein